MGPVTLETSVPTVNKTDSHVFSKDGDTIIASWVTVGPSRGIFTSTSIALSLPGLPEVDLPTMSTPWILYRLYSLDASSPDFLRVLCSLIRYDEKEQYLIGLQGSELARMVDFLDKVYAVPSAFHQFTKQTPQALSVIPITDNVARECLNKLQTICGRHATLPSSYIVSGEIVRVGDGPIALGAIADVWEGSYRGKKVSVKSLGVAMKNYQATKKVRILCGTSLSRLLKTLVGPVVILRRRHYVEKIKASEHRPFHWRHNTPFANRLGVDAERNSGRVHREKPRCEAGQPGEPFPVNRT